MIKGNVSETEPARLRGKIRAIPVIDKTLTKEGQCAEAKATGDAINARVKVADIVDNLTSEATDKPLSAKQGAELKRMIDVIAGSL